MVALFGLCAWIGGALVLPHLMRSSADRWAVAVGAAAVVSALAGTWAAAWAGRAEPAAPERSAVIGRDNNGIVSTGDNARNTQSR